MSTVTSRDGTTIAFERSGEGPALVLVGGALSDRRSAAALVEMLAPRFTTFSYDRRGRGDSADTPPYAVEREIEDLQALVDGASGTAFAFGHSSGAALVLEAAAVTPAITRIALYEPPFIVDDTRPPLPEDYVQHLNMLVSTGRPGEAVEYFLVTGVGVPPDAIGPMKESASWPALAAMAHTLPYDGLVLGDHMSGAPLPPDSWERVTVPALVIVGGASPPWLANAVQSLVDVLPDARRLTMGGQTHEVDPALLAPALIEFLAD